jgi:acyl-CoA synthetase (AMP-forming)/AMP-acid ligase II
MIAETLATVSLAAPSDLIGLLRLRALRQPDQRAYTFVTDDDVAVDYLTYSLLDRRARAIAALLEDQGAKGERVLLLYPPGLEFIEAFFGCLYSGAIAIPYPLPSRQQLERVQLIVADAQVSTVLTTAALLPGIKQRLDHSELQWLSTDDVALERAEYWREPAPQSGLAYLQYTSGSTSMPKGVMVSHANVLHNAAYLDHVFDHGTDTVVITWLPHFHDMGLIYGVILPLFKGHPCYAMTPLSIVQQPIRWLRAIARYRGTHTVGPNFAYAHCIRKIKKERCEGLDLSSWRVAINGSEPVRQETLEEFTRRFKPYGFKKTVFCPGYGLAEATLMVSGTLRRDKPAFCTVAADKLSQHQVVEYTLASEQAKTLMGNGKPTFGTTVLIVDPETSLECPADRIGEIWVGGPSVTLGYWNRSEETETKFRAHLADTGAGPFLRTGDLGFLLDGELYVTGRISDLIIIAGRNYYPQDIELTVQHCHAAIRPGCCAAFSVDVEGEERLIVAAEVDHRPANNGNGTLNGKEIVQAIREAVAATHQLQAYEIVLLRSGAIPKTSSGKIRRKDCRIGFQTQTLNRALLNR